MTVAYIALGSNLGDRGKNIERALGLLGKTPGVRPLKVSRLYQTKPEGYRDQPDFLNGVAQVETGLSPRELLGRLKQIEKEVGRRRRCRNGPREIDLDLVLYSRRVIRGGGLTVPHARMHRRGFVLHPLAEIAPGVVHPVLRKRIGTLWRELSHEGGRKGKRKKREGKSGKEKAKQ